MRWIELSVETPPEFVEPLTQVFIRHGHGGVAIDGLGGYNPDEGEFPPETGKVVVKTYVPCDPHLVERRSRIDVAVRLVAHVGDLSPLRARTIEEEEWQEAWKQHFYVLHIGRRIVIVPTWRKYQPKESEVIIGLDPGMAFGTGHHPTTRMCLERLEGLVSSGANVLDVGCGSGILSIAAAKLGATAVFAFEIDSVAVEVASRNVENNDVSDKVFVAEGTLPHKDVRPGGYEVVVANISAKVILDLAEGLVAAAKAGGKLLLSGILDDHKELVTARIGELGARIETVETDEGWVVIQASKA